jgi:hypothetical protein
LLGVADPVASDKDGNGVGATDCVFKRRDPTETRSKLASVKESMNATGAEPLVQIRRQSSVDLGVAQKNVVTVVAFHSAPAQVRVDFPTPNLL